MTDIGELPVAALAADTVERISPDATVVELAQALTGTEVGLLVVVGVGDRVQAVVSERDVVRAVAEGRDPAGTRVGDVASATVRWCDATASVAEVAEAMMEHYVRHVLLETDGQLVGIVSARDLLGAYASAEAQGEG